MIKKMQVSNDFFVSLRDTVVTSIQTIGEYDTIHRREFPSEEEAENYYNALCGKEN